tara:strand:- start:3545 stop:4309 length:765 start_codon:yes stop_codon:yes gene_type:complete
MVEYVKDEITAILTVWKRHQNLEAQIRHLLCQTKRPHQIWIYQNESHFNIGISEETKKQYNISVIQSRDINFKFHGRFALPLLCDTEYTAIFDDDTMPGSRWLENCLDTSKRNNCIVGANGRSMKSGFEEVDGQHMVSYGDGRSHEEETEVDFVGHCWFFKTSWAKNIWLDRPYTWDNGEDIHFAAACQIHEGVGCYIPRMPAADKSLWGDTQPHLGGDEHATWKKASHGDIRGEIVKYWCDKGWVPLTNRSEK